MDSSDYEAHADYWSRMAEQYPDDYDVLAMRVLTAADYIVQLAVMDFYNEP